MKNVITFDPKEEADLLMDWFETVQFDKPSKGIPDVNYPDDDEEDADEEKALSPFWIGARAREEFDAEEKAVRHVRTPAGERRFGQPIGSIIVRDGRVLQNIKIGAPKYKGFQHVTDKNGREYDVGRHDGKWIATRSGTWDVVVSADSEEGIYEALDKHVGGGRGSRATPAPKKPVATRTAATASNDVVKGKRTLQVPPAYMKFTVKNPEANVLHQVEEGKLDWRGGRPAGISDADNEKLSDLLFKYMEETDALAPWELRGSNASSEARTQIDKVMAASPLSQPILVWRGVGDPKHMFGESLKGNMKGEEFLDHSYASTSPNRSIAEDFANGQILMQMQVPAGTGAIALGHDGEEILLDRDIKHQVTSDSGPGTSPRVIKTIAVPRNQGSGIKPTRTRTTAPKAGSEQPVKFRVVKSDIPGYERFDGEDGKSYYGAMDTEANEYVIFDAADNEVAVGKDKNGALVKLDAHIKPKRTTAPKAPGYSTANPKPQGSTGTRLAKPETSKPVARAKPDSGPKLSDEHAIGAYESITGDQWMAMGQSDFDRAMEAMNERHAKLAEESRSARTAAARKRAKDQAARIYDVVRTAGVARDAKRRQAKPQATVDAAPAKKPLPGTAKPSSPAGVVAKHSKRFYAAGGEDDMRALSADEAERIIGELNTAAKDPKASKATQMNASGLAAAIRRLHPAQRPSERRAARNETTSQAMERNARGTAKPDMNHPDLVTNQKPTEKAVLSKPRHGTGPGPQHEPSSTVRLKPHQLRTGMRVRARSSYSDDIAPEERNKIQWYTIGQVGREYRTAMWASSRASTAGMYHLTDTRGHHLDTASPNMLFHVDESTVKGDEQHRVRAARIGYGNDAVHVTLPSEYAMRELGMPKPQMSGGELKKEDPNYGYPAIADKMQERINRTQHDPTKAERMLERSRFLMDDSEALDELMRARQLRTSDPRWGDENDRVLKQIDRRIEMLRARLSKSSYLEMTLVLKDLIDHLEEKRGVVRTAAGAERYKLPIGTPIPEGGARMRAPKLDEGTPVRKMPKRVKLSDEMAAHRDGFRKLQRRFKDYPMLGQIAKVVADRISEGKITDEATLNAELRDALSPEIIALLFSRIKGENFWDFEVKEIQDIIERKADEPHTGAMIALVPTETDAHRLAVEDGEDPSELHVTLAFLGKASNISQDARESILQGAGRLAFGQMGFFKGRLFGANVFNPTGPEPCFVLGVGDASRGALPLMYSGVIGLLLNAETETGFRNDEQHTPWVPHITLKYFEEGKVDWDWVAKHADKASGEVEFDRLRVAFGGLNVDFPLRDASYQPQPADASMKALVWAACTKSISADERRAMGKRGVAMPNGDFPIPDEDHLRSAIRLLGRYKGDKDAAKAHIKKRARALGLEDMLPEDWDSKAMVITPGGRVGRDDSGDRSPRHNWVEDRGGLPKYIRVIANGIKDKKPGTSESRAIALAVSAVKRWAAGRGNVSPKVRAAAAKAVAQWEAMKGTKAATPGQPDRSGNEAPGRGGYLAGRMADAHRSNLGSQAAVDDFNSKHPRDSGKFAHKPGAGKRKRDTASSLTEGLAKRLPAKYGQQSPVIQQIQVILKTLGYDVEDDGIYGDKVVSAVKKFQKEAGLKESGEVDVQTMEAMLNVARRSGTSGHSRRHK